VSRPTWDCGLGRSRCCASRLAPPTAKQGLATVCLPGLTGQLYLDSPQDVQRYEAALDGIASCSLDEPATRELLLAAAREIDP
jgi:hypothetical protein